MTNQFDLYATNVKNALENWGAPGPNAKFHKNDRVVEYSTFTLSAGSDLPASINFFATGQATNSALSTTTFPLNGRAVDILGLRIDHCLKLSVSDAGLANEQQQLLEATSRFQINYRNRRNILDVSLADLVNHMSFLDGNDVITAPAPGITRFLMLKEPIRYGATAPIDFTLNFATGQTLETSTASSTPVVPAGVGAAYWIKLSLLTTQYTAI